MDAMVIKSEPQEFEYIKPLTLIENIESGVVEEPAQNVSNLKFRCGEIFVTNNAKKWNFTCTHCNKTTRDIGEFICHIQFKHMNGQYTEQDDNGANTDELQTREAAYTENSYNNQEQNIYFQTLTQTEGPSQTIPLSIPKTEQNSPLAINNTPSFENSTNFVVSSLADINNTFETSSNFEGVASTTSDKEWTLNTATSQQNYKFLTASTSQNINRAKRRLDHEENSFSIENGNFNIKEKENDDEMVVEEENDEIIENDGMEANTLICIKEEPKIDDQTVSEEHVQQHRKLKSKKTKLSSIKCQYCNKAFKTKQALSNHIKTHTKTYEYQCPMCTLCHSTENQFITHVLMHESDTCFPCMVCGKDLKSDEERDKHLATHIEERPFGCDFCKRRFRQNNFLTNHLRIHCQYRCDFCPNDFRSIQTQRRPYVCPQCENVPDVRQKVESQRALSAKNQIVETDADANTEDANKTNVRKSTDTLLFAYKPDTAHDAGSGSISPELTYRIGCQYCPATFINDNNLINHIHKKHGTERII